MDRVLWPALPAGVLLVMLVAYLATRVGLRPVERIRAETAGITSRDLDGGYRCRRPGTRSRNWRRR